MASSGLPVTADGSTLPTSVNPTSQAGVPPSTSPGPVPGTPASSRNLSHEPESLQGQHPRADHVVPSGYGPPIQGGNMTVSKQVQHRLGVTREMGYSLGAARLRCLSSRTALGQARDTVLVRMRQARSCKVLPHSAPDWTKACIAGAGWGACPSISQRPQWGPPTMNYGMGYSKYLDDAAVITSWTYLCASRYEHTEPNGAVDAWGQREHDGTRWWALCRSS